MTADVRVETVLADTAAVADGLLYLQGGGWSYLRPSSLPMVVGRIGIGIVLHLPAGTAAARVTVRATGPDGTPLSLTVGDDPSRALDAVEAVVDPGPLPEGSPLDEHVVPLALNLDGVVLERAGVHHVAVLVDGAERGRASFAVIPEA